MAVICEECGKVYYVDPEKVKKYRGRKIRIRCSECGHATDLSRLFGTDEPPGVYSGDEPPYEDGSLHKPSYFEPVEESEPDYIPPEELGLSPIDTEPSDSGVPPEVFHSASESSGGDVSKGWIGLRGKMFFLFFVIPVAFIAASGYFSQMRLEETVSKITSRSSDIAAESGRKRILQKAKDVALQCEIYLRFNPYLQREDFSYNPEFKRIAVQKFGKTGYTFVIQEPEEGQGWTFWTHPNPNLIGIDDIDTLRKALGQYFDEYFSIIEKSKGRSISAGTYMWKDNKGNQRKKHMAVAPINIEGKPFSVISTAYLDEFAGQTRVLEKEAAEMTADTRDIIIAILAGAVLVIGFCIIIFGWRVSRNIRNLTEAADRISAGDFETEIEVRSSDQIGRLAEAVSRIQDGMRLYSERLRKSL